MESGEVRYAYTPIAPLTAVDDQDFLAQLEVQKNLPAEVEERLRRLW